MNKTYKERSNKDTILYMLCMSINTHTQNNNNIEEEDYMKMKTLKILKILKI